MENFQSLLPSKIYETLEKCDIAFPKQILTLSASDIGKITHLNTNDILLLKATTSSYFSPKCVTGSILLKQDILNKKVTIGVCALDTFLEGGLRRGTVTELYGESGSGKTQLGIQAAVHNWKSGCVYICTEDLFPVKRFEQVKQSLPDYNSNTNYGRNIFIEHITEASDLMSCVKVRLPKLLNKINASIIILDSVAAPYRCDTDNYVQRAEELKEFGILLLHIAQKFNLAVLCINQVTALCDGTNDVLPSLGLSWSNMVSSRFLLKKTGETVIKYDEELNSNQEFQLRELDIIFSPELPTSYVKFIVTSRGIQAINVDRKPLL